MKVILYTTHCPKCNVLTAKLKKKEVKLSEVSLLKLIISYVMIRLK